MHQMEGGIGEWDLHYIYNDSVYFYGTIILLFTRDDLERRHE